MDDKNTSFFIKEYEKLKDEQRVRIQFRDQMIFVTLGAIGAVFSFVLGKTDYWIILLVLPFVTFLLGWTYIANDDKISEIGHYIRDNLKSKLDLSSWECYHKSTSFRKLKKTTQLTVDILIFCVAPSLSVILFFIKNNDFSWYYVFLGIIEFILIGYIAALFCMTSPLFKKK